MAAQAAGVLLHYALHLFEGEICWFIAVCWNVRIDGDSVIIGYAGIGRRWALGALFTNKVRTIVGSPCATGLAV